MSRKIQMTIFAKSRDTQDKKRKFTAYNGRLTRKDGVEISVGVKFRQPANGPDKDECPCNIIFDVEDANLQTRHDDDKKRDYYTLWITKYDFGEPYEDHSLDDF